MRSSLEPILWNRSFFAWANFLLFLLNIIIILRTPLDVGSIILAFASGLAGLAFAFWLQDSIFQSQDRVIDKSLALNRKLLADRKERYVNKINHTKI